MTSEALTVVRGFFDLAAARDFAGVTDCLDPNVVWFGTRGGLDEQQIVRGPDAWMEYWQEIETPWQRFEFAVEQLIDVADTIVAFLRETARARHADLEVQNETAMTFKVARQKIIEATGYLDREEALSAARQTH